GWTGPRIGLIYIDGDHSFEGAVDDFEAWRPHLAADAVIAFDDYGAPSLPGVKQAVDYLVAEGRITEPEVVGGRLAISRLPCPTEASCRCCHPWRPSARWKLGLVLKKARWKVLSWTGPWPAWKTPRSLCGTSPSVTGSSSTMKGSRSLVTTGSLWSTLRRSSSRSPAMWPGGCSPTRTPRSRRADRKSTRLNSSHVKISYAVFCLKKKKY